MLAIIVILTAASPFRFVGGDISSPPAGLVNSERETAIVVVAAASICEGESASSAGNDESRWAKSH
jgi:hypothetical protein